MNSEQILTSHIIIDEYLKAIIEFDSDFSELNKETLVNYCLMKDKYVSILKSIQFNIFYKLFLTVFQKFVFKYISVLPE